MRRLEVDMYVWEKWVMDVEGAEWVGSRGRTCKYILGCYLFIYGVFKVCFTVGFN